MVRLSCTSYVPLSKQNTVLLSLMSRTHQEMAVTAMFLIQRLF